MSGAASKAAGAASKAAGAAASKGSAGLHGGPASAVSSVPSKCGPVFRLARPEEAERVRGFVNTNFDWKLPLVNLPEYFDYYYRPFGANSLQFALAEEGGQLLAAAGYILANRSPAPDVWVSVWVAAAGHNGVGLELMAALPGLTNARLLACNNIRPKTMAFYRFLGWHAGRLPHYYRLADLPEYRLARIRHREILPAGGDLALTRIENAARLDTLALPESPCAPHKDTWYIKRRYFDFPGFSYEVYAAPENGRTLALLAARVVDTAPGSPENARVLRIVDYIGAPETLPRLGSAIDRLLRECGAEYAELYCFGIDPALLAAAGFCERREGDENILPNYLTPPLYENTEYYFFTNVPENFVLFKADGDQDKPNLQLA